ncbi:MAG: ribosome small subunit-dependent GTPase, partial [Armatimonadetes bacterium]|nr:ribosome small subunit-dependent GTPase [Armatimonadota bacterium]
MPIGIVSVVFGARCEVLEGTVSVPCLLRGRLKKAADSIAVGDHVEFAWVDAHTGVVERILPRRNELSRSNRERPRRRRDATVFPRQVVLANPDQVVFVAAARDPGINFELLDRALALARTAGLPSAICVNKMDLAAERDVMQLMRPYERLGARVLYTSAEQRRGLEDLEPLLKEKVSFFWGGSGVGKSSLIRAITGADLKVGHWRTDNPRGPHTTNVTRLYPLPYGGLIADTPGFDWLALDTVEAASDQVELLLPEALTLAESCRFPGCGHCGEPDCAVMAAVLDGRIDRGRYSRFRVSVAESHPPTRHPTELVSEGEQLFFRMREGNTSLWTTLQLYYLFEDGHPERDGLLATLDVPITASEPQWFVFQERQVAGLASRTALIGKLTGLEPASALVEVGQELILRERGIVKGVARISAVQPEEDAWRLRKPLKGTPIYDTHAF